MMGNVVVTDRVMRIGRSPRLLGWARGVNAQGRNVFISVGIDSSYKDGTQGFILNAYLVMWLKFR